MAMKERGQMKRGMHKMPGGMSMKDKDMPMRGGKKKMMSRKKK